MNRTYKSTTFLVLALAFCLFAYACTVDRATLSPTRSAELASIEEAQAAAAVSGDQVAIDAAEARMDEFEGQVLQENGGLLVGSAAAVSPALAPWASLATLLIPLLGKRGRKHAGNAMKSLAKGRLPTFLVDVAKASGAVHSSEDTKAVANGTSVAVPTGEGAAVVL